MKHKTWSAILLSLFCIFLGLSNQLLFTFFELNTQHHRQEEEGGLRLPLEGVIG